MYADLRYQQELAAWHEQIRACRLDLIKSENITPNVLRALALDWDHRLALIDRYVPRLLHKPVRLFAGEHHGGMAHPSPKPGQRVYMNFVLQKR